MQWPGKGIGINTERQAPTVASKTLTVKLVFIDEGTPATGGTVALGELSPDKFNFYLVARLQRGNEIHMSDRVPTDMANTSLFGTLADDSKPSTGKYYKTENNLPWGINILQGFDHTIEKKPINQGYLYFVKWAESAGTIYSDWYLNLSGYRDNANIY
jgi:LruC domain-containing protein